MKPSTSSTRGKGMMMARLHSRPAADRASLCPCPTILDLSELLRTASYLQLPFCSQPRHASHATLCMAPLTLRHGRLCPFGWPGDRTLARISFGVVSSLEAEWENPRALIILLCTPGKVVSLGNIEEHQYIKYILIGSRLRASREDLPRFTAFRVRAPTKPCGLRLYSRQSSAATITRCNFTTTT